MVQILQFNWIGRRQQFVNVWWWLAALLFCVHTARVWEWKWEPISERNLFSACYTHTHISERGGAWDLMYFGQCTPHNVYEEDWQRSNRRHFKSNWNTNSCSNSYCVLALALRITTHCTELNCKNFGVFGIVSQYHLFVSLLLSLLCCNVLAVDFWCRLCFLLCSVNWDVGLVVRDMWGYITDS